jgi:putative ABC transport system permease protein
VIQAYEPEAELHRSLDRALRPIPLPEHGLLLTDWLAEQLQVRPGDPITVEVLEGERPRRVTHLEGLAREYVGVSGTMRLDALNDLMREGPVISGVYLQVDPRQLDELYARLRAMPRVAGSSLRTASIDSFLDTMGENLLIFSLVNTLLAGVIAFGVVYNTARLALAERSRELASLRVLGFTRGEASYILLGELAFITLVAIPLGLWIGFWLCALLAASMASEFYRIPAVLHADAYGTTALIILAAASLSAVAVALRIRGLDLVAVLKSHD